MQSESKIGLQGCIPSGGSGEDLFPCLVQLLETITYLDLWPQPAIIPLWPLLPSHHLLLWFWPSYPPLVAPLWSPLGPVEIIQDNLSTFKSPNLISSAKSLSPYKVTGTGSRDSLLGAIIQPTMAYPQWREDRAQNLPDSCLRAIELILQFLSLPQEKIDRRENAKQKLTIQLFWNVCSSPLPIFYIEMFGVSLLSCRSAFIYSEYLDINPLADI